MVLIHTRASRVYMTEVIRFGYLLESRPTSTNGEVEMGVEKVSVCDDE